MPSSKLIALIADKARGRREKAADLYNALEQSLGRPPKSGEIRSSLKNLISTYFPDGGMAELRALAAQRKAGSS